jgi:hypothetical protein
MGSKKDPKNESKVRKKLALKRDTLKDLAVTSRQGKAVKGGRKPYSQSSAISGAC